MVSTGLERTGTLEQAPPQYTRTRILATWAAAAVPMGVLAWVVAPALAGRLEGPTALPRALIVTLTAGLVWQFVLVLWCVHREQGSLRWATAKDALWLHAPRRPASGRRGGRAWLVVVPLVVALAAVQLLPTLPAPGTRDMGMFLESGAGQVFLAGNWSWLLLIIAMHVFNTALGEELLFRGLLLPRMRGSFGRWDWVANGVLFALYHVHVPWAMPKVLLDTFILAYPARRYRSAALAIAVHSAQSVVLSALVIAVVLA